MFIASGFCLGILHKPKVTLSLRGDSKSLTQHRWSKGNIVKENRFLKIIPTNYKHK